MPPDFESGRRKGRAAKSVGKGPNNRGEATNVRRKGTNNWKRGTNNRGEATNVRGKGTNNWKIGTNNRGKSGNDRHSHRPLQDERAPFRIGRL